MEIIIKILKALFYDDGEMNKTTATKIKDALLWMILGAIMFTAALFYFADDSAEDDAEETETEYVEDE